MKYFEILNLKKEPFSNSPDPEFFFRSSQHEECLQKLEISLRLKRGLNLVIGNVGTGKTTLCRQLIRKFSEDNLVETHLILDPDFHTALDFLTCLAKKIIANDIETTGDERAVKEKIKDCLFRKGVDQGRTIILIIDEGQKIPGFCLEILRELLNYETNEYKLLQIVIFAQKEFRELEDRHGNFFDRISLFHELNPMDFKDTRRMILFRLEKSGGARKKLFSYPAFWAVYRITGGYPRKIINLCHSSVLAMIIQNRSRVGFKTIKSCGRRVFTGEKRNNWKKSALLAGLIGIICLVLVVVPETIEKHLPKTDPGSSRKPEQALIGKNLTNHLVKDQVETKSIKEKSLKTDKKIVLQAPRALGKVKMEKGQSLWKMISVVYGRYNKKCLEEVIRLNPWIDEPGNISAGKSIYFPALALQIKPVGFKCWWVKVYEGDKLGRALHFLFKYSIDEPRIRLIPRWDVRKGLKFTVILQEHFFDENSARKTMAMLSGNFSENCEVFSDWGGKETVFYSNPYSMNS